MLRRVRFLPLLIILVAAGLSPGVTFAQEPAYDQPYDTLIRANGPVHIAAGESAQGVVVVRNTVTIDGTADFVVAIDGNAIINGTVRESVVAVNGTVTLNEGARVGKDILLYRAQAVQQPGAIVGGGIRNEWGGFTVGRGFWLGVWLNLTVAFLVAGLIFAAAGGRQLRAAGAAIIERPAATLLTTVVLAVGAPVVTFALLATVLGAPLAFGLLLFVLPALWFFGYLVAGAAAGALLFRLGGQAAAERPYLHVAVGLLALQVIALVPFIGGMVAFLAGVVGAGALVHQAWTTWRGAATARPAGAAMGPAAPAV
ncbi:MAG: hypothetical protein U0531_03720 [Dehalococcoidia bacterium]